MKPKMIAKICVDVGMIIALLLLMPYELIGQVAHEWIGIGIFILFIVHHILNGKWSRNALKGKYTPLRIWQTILVIFALVSMIGSMVSGVILSRHAFLFYRSVVDVLLEEVCICLLPTGALYGCPCIWGFIGA